MIEEDREWWDDDDEPEDEVMERVRENIVAHLQNMARWDTMTNEMEPEEHVAWIAAEAILDLQAQVKRWEDKEVHEAMGCYISEKKYHQAIHTLERIISATPHSMCSDAEAWAEAEQLIEDWSNSNDDAKA